MNEKHRSYAAVGILCCFLALICLYLGQQNKLFTKEIMTLEGGWSLTINGIAAERQPGELLEAFIFPELKRGDRIVFERVFREEDQENKVIAFDTWHMLTKVYLDDQFLYHWGEEYEEKGLMLGAARHNVSLPDSVHGRTLRLEFMATEDKPMPYLTSVGYFEGSNENAFWFNRPLALLFIGVFFVFLGIVIHFIASVFVMERKQFIEPLSLGLSIILTGVYILSRGFFVQLLIKDPQIYNAVEYVSLFLIPIPVLSYWFYEAMECKVKSVRIFYMVTLILNVVFVAGSIFLNFVTNIHLCQVLTYYYILVLGVAVSVGLLIRYRDKKAGILRRRIYLFGICSFIGGAILSIVAFALCFNPQVAGLLQLYRWYDFILPFSMCILVVFFIMAFYMEMKQILNNSYQSEFLNFVAYYDALTQLLNRRSFEEDMEKIQAGDQYGIISIDINGLKQVNDTFGHQTGDAMLKSFGELFAECCGSSVRTFRIGGDEFAALAMDESALACAKLIHKIQKAITKFNREEHTFKLSAACGMALSEECETPLAVWELADQRMYLNKKEMKEENHGEVFNYRRI